MCPARAQEGVGKVSSSKGSLRELMPQTAEIVDWLRQQLGTAAADRIVLGGKQGKGTFWAQETGADGQVREFGSRRPRTQWPQAKGVQQ